MHAREAAKVAFSVARI